LSQRLVSDDFTQSIGKGWKAAKGKWEIVDGALKGTELAADMHGAAPRHPLPAQNVIIRYSFKLGP